jgi:hypothetical protein
MKLRLRSLLFPRNVASPGGLLARAAVLAILYLSVHALGFRQYTSILCGTLPPGGRAALGVAYIILYFAFVLIVPILVLGAATLWVLQRWLLRPGGEVRVTSPQD